MDKASALRAFILENINSSAWLPGHRLPTERALCEQFAISRSTVRRALAELKDQGLIAQRVGSGTYVISPASLPPIVPFAQTEVVATSPADLMAARLELEPAIATLVVLYATTADFARLDEACDRADGAASFVEFEHWDTQLHERMARATHNAIIANMFAMMTAARSHASWDALRRKNLTSERQWAYHHQHREIVDALKDRDAQRAMARMRSHLVHARENLLGS